MRISVIIPALNEGANIRGTVACALSGGAFEVIVADGGSSDDTLNAAGKAGARTISTGRGRGLQMDEGAAASTGDVLLFLHADTRLPADWLETVSRIMVDERNVAGAFRLRIDSPRTGFRVLERMITARYKALGVVYGDQAIFVRKDAFLKAGGFNKLPLMEDIDCVKRLWTLGRVALADSCVKTSPRRWERRGILGNTVRNLSTLFLYHVGVSPRTLYRWYYGGDAKTLES